MNLRRANQSTVRGTDASQPVREQWEKGRARKVVALVVVNITVFGGLLVVTEAAFRLFDSNYVFYSRTQPGQFKDQRLAPWVRKDPDLGWVVSGPIPNYRINRQGFRDSKDFTRIDYRSGKTRIMMLGDSMLYGPHVDEQRVISTILEQKLSGYEVYNLGVPGWGLDQMYLSYKKYVDLIKPQIVMLLYIDDDVLRIYEAYRVWEGMNKPSFSLDQNRLVPRKPDPLWLQYIINNSIVANKLSLIYRNFETRRLAHAIFANLSTETQQRGQQFVVLRLPGLHDGRDGWGFQALFTEGTSRYMDLRDQMPRDEKLYIPDLHFSAEGTSYVAQLLSNLDNFTRASKR